MQHRDDGMHKLIPLLRERRGVLMVGAGSSAIIGYPPWKELANELREKVAPDLPELPEEPMPTSDDILKHLDRIKKSAANNPEKIEEYYRVLDRTFAPRKDCQNHTKFHSTLIELGFCGLVTTNYDTVLESAAGEVCKGKCNYCEPIDLCDKGRRYRVFDFLRSLSPENLCTSVLHLHGCYNNPKEIILTGEDYLDKYGIKLQEKDAAPNAGRILDSFHRKVIWSLLVMHPLVFVGFSMSDPFFMDLLNIALQDFSLRGDTVHLAIMGYSDDDEREEIKRRLKYYGVQPVFYYAPKDKDGTVDHRGLQNMISHLQNILETEQQKPTEPKVEQREEIKIPTKAGLPSLDEINKRTLGMY